MGPVEFVDAPGVRIAYHDVGPRGGPVAVLLHGWPYAPVAYQEVAARLTGQGVRCIIPYLRGFAPTRVTGVMSGQQAALAADVLALMDAQGIARAVLAGFDWGGRAACIVAALYPDRVAGLVSCGVGYNIQNIAAAAEPADAAEEARYWYIYLFQLARGAALLERDRHGLCRHIWKLWSPDWDSAALYDASATAFDSPDFVPIVLHSYRHRLGNAPGDPAFDAMEDALAAQPQISVPSIVLQGSSDQVDPPGDHASLARFTGLYTRKVLDRVGHNPPQEDPEAFAAAVLELMRPAP